ncbi:hypothetical protein EZJ43_03465 [Pedobacter changchengzhani]|uniref:Glycerophosphoryl diester phosphodiesterase membrane domain-containing protein n=1 Tax=Pedobacter changchengzhani TaxID=2529274 RepID=A0A4R5MN29_9SPHI|nr:hypothetical protein [Pedobacter changchengzhani]TDG37190.1 hypothetical protein EZJ43_03465 [Pedobacter changchengzhani]
MQEKLEFKKKRDFSQIINDTFLFLRQNLKPLLKIYFIFCGLFVLAGMLSALMYQYKTINLVNGGSPASAFNFSRMFGLEYFLVIVFALVSYASVTVAILSYITLYVQKGNQIPSTDEVWAYYKFYFLRVFGSSLLLSLMLGVATLFCLVPGFYLFPFVAIMMPIMVIENGTLGYSFGRSFKLIKDNFWTTFGTIMIVWIIVYAGMSLITLPTTILSMVGLFTKNNPSMSLTFTAISTVLQYLCQAFTVIPIITVSLCYFSLAEDKERTGLMEKISQFGNLEKPIDHRPEEY